MTRTRLAVIGFIALTTILLIGTIVCLWLNDMYYPQPHLATLFIAALRTSRWNRAAARIESGMLDSKSKAWAAIRAAIDKSALASIRLEADPLNKDKLEDLKMADKALSKALRLHR